MQKYIESYILNSFVFIQDYLNYYTVFSFFFFMIIGMIWKRIYPVGFIKKTFYYFWFLLSLPGTIGHELMHFLVGVFFNAKPRGFSLIPKKVEDGYVMGSVSFINMNSLNAFPVAMAPFLLLPFSFWAMTYFHGYFILNEPLYKIFAGFLIYNLWISSIPSVVDFKILLKFPMTIVLYGIIFFATYQIYIHGVFKNV